MMHSGVPNSRVAKAYFHYVEVRHAGQAFRLGRYPIHFHIDGDVRGSYVKGCAVHHSFNRAITIHGVHNLVVEENVIYDILGLCHLILFPPIKLYPTFKSIHTYLMLMFAVVIKKQLLKPTICTKI